MMLSGIGDPEVLAEQGIKTLVSSPEVGKKLTVCANIITIILVFSRTHVKELVLIFLGSPNFPSLIQTRYYEYIRRVLPRCARFS